MGFSFEKKSKGKKEVGSSLDDKAMAKRLKQEADRYKDATDSEIWSCLCFKTEADRDSFIAKTGIPNRRFILGEELREATEKFKPKERKRGFARKPKSTANTPDPLADVDYTKSLEQTCIDEAMALKAAMLSAKRPDPCGEATDSDIWICVVYNNREESEEYLDDMNLRKHGDKYIDASAWLKELK